MEVNVLKVYSGDDEPLRMEFRAPNDSPIDLVSAGVQDIQFTVKDDNGNELIHKSLLTGGIVYVTDGTDGLLDIGFFQDDTFSLEGTFEYDIQIRRNDLISTVVKSFITIVQDINERTT